MRYSSDLFDLKNPLICLAAVMQWKST